MDELAAAEAWLKRGRELGAEGKAWGFTQICPLHLRPMLSDWPNAPRCGCASDTSREELLAIHGLAVLLPRLRLKPSANSAATRAD